MLKDGSSDWRTAPLTPPSSLFVYRPHFEIPVCSDGILGRNLPREPAVIGRRTTEGKWLRNRQARVTMETHPCEVLLRSHPLQSPWRPWQRTEYSNLAWLFAMATQARPLRRQPRGHFYGDPLGRPSRAPCKSPLGACDAVCRPSKAAQNAKVTETKEQDRGSWNDRVEIQ